MLKSSVVSAQTKLLREADIWFRAILHKDELEPHEARLFLAVVEWRNQLKEGGFPSPPKLPEIPPPLRPKPPPLPKRKSRSGIRPRTLSEPITKPIPSRTQQHLIAMSRLEYPEEDFKEEDTLVAVPRPTLKRAR